MNIGFDTNHDASDDIFYFADNAWYKTSFTGALLLRPVLGQDIILGTGRLLPEGEISLNVYPNPAQNQLRFTAHGLTPGVATEVAVYNLFGQLVSRRTLHRNLLNTSFLSNGMYLLRIKSGNRIYSAKFIIKH